MITSRVPGFANKSHIGMSRWFDEMCSRGLLFHPEDRPTDIVDIATGQPCFTEEECMKLDALLAEMFDRFGNEVCEAAYPIFMKTAGLPRTNQ